MARPIGAAGGRPGGSDRAVPRASIGQPSGGGGGFAASPGDRPSAVPRSGAGGLASRPGVTASAPATRAAPRGGIADRTGEPATANRFGSGTSWPADRTGAARPRAGGMASPSAGSGGGSTAARERDYWPSRQTPRATPGSPGGGGGTSAGAVPRRSTPSGSAGTVGRAPGSTYGATRAPSGSPGTWRTPGAAAAQPRDRTPAGAGGGSTSSSPVPRTYERTTPRSSTPLPGANERRGRQQWQHAGVPAVSPQPDVEPPRAVLRASLGSAVLVAAGIVGAAFLAAVLHTPLHARHSARR